MAKTAGLLQSDDPGRESGGQALVFGPFRLLPAQRTLLRDGKPLRLGGRALDILISLASRAGEVVGKKDLLAQVWPETSVDEISLRVHIAALRKVLGDGTGGARYIANISGRGYSFVAPVIVESNAGQTHEAPVTSVSGPADGHDLPASLNWMIGRGEIVTALAAQVTERRFVTIVGPGGIGKTTVAIAIAENLIHTHEHRARFVDLASLSDPLLVPSALASALGISIISEDPMPGLLGFLADQDMLILLDNCEHVINAAAALAESILKNAPGIRILATSREPLRAMGEQVHRLASLEMPPPSSTLTAKEALAFPAVQLFAERAIASLDTFEVTDADAPILADICRQLDGIPLAIELAAARVDVFGIHELAARLDDRFRILMQGRRTALPRQKTLRGMLDWSYDTLSSEEQSVLRRLAVFKGAFTMEAAAFIAVSAHTDASTVCECVTSLAAKSLVNVDVSGHVVYYRLLDTTRAYGLEKLVAENGFELSAHRHADYYLDFFERAGADWEVRPAKELTAIYWRQVDNLRAALDWAFSSYGDPAIGVRLTLAAVPLWTYFSLAEESRTRVERVLLDVEPGPHKTPHQEMQLYAALGAALVQTTGGPEAEAALRKAFEIAERIGAGDYSLKTLWGLWIGRYMIGDYAGALMVAKTFLAADPHSASRSEILIGERLLGATLLVMGDLSGARRHLEHMLARYAAPADRSHLIRFQYDQRTAAHAFCSQVLWLQGFPDQALRMAEENVADAQTLDHLSSLRYALTLGACPVSLMANDFAAADRFAKMVLGFNAAYRPWDIWGRCYEGVLLIKRGKDAAGAQHLVTALGELPKTAFQFQYTIFIGMLALAFGRLGDFTKSRAAIEEALEKCAHTGESWCLAELLRIQGECLLLENAAAGPEAERLFQNSIGIARKQGALSWELRSSLSLAGLWQHQDRRGEALALLQPVYDQFTEGFGTADLQQAGTLLKNLAG